MIRLLLVSCLALSATAVETVTAPQWTPSDHPAFVSRTLTAFTRPVAELTISSEDAARLQSIAVREGQIIGTKDSAAEVVVASLDTSTADDALAVATARYAAANAQVESLRSNLSSRQRDEAWWKSEQQRIKNLVEQGTRPTREADEAQWRADSATLMVAAARSSIAAAEAEAQAAGADLQRYQTVVARHQLRAPAGWTVAERRVEPGAFVTVGSPILHLVDVRRLELPLRLSEQELASIIGKESISVTLSDGRTVDASLAYVDPRFDAQSRKRAVMLTLDGAEFEPAGGGIEVRVLLRLPLEDALLVPKDFISRTFEQTLVTTADQQVLPVVPLRSEGDFVVIAADALPAGTTLIRPE